VKRGKFQKRLVCAGHHEFKPIHNFDVFDTFDDLLFNEISELLEI